ncbi:gamma-glutamyltransferase [Nannocystis punicea]|uniref:Glutathione hydrolase proenzyme n=1 Tax=Nannocystis punicea TaxID=2995304 RepID=A0ABY7HKM4_9BACT|nr:gamma-glutamyltransferase [Nannocystis poenicansa]WAS99454.1 gamma-glutamyltransferase [Nannocystis poenicansa]
MNKHVATLAVLLAVTGACPSSSKPGAAADPMLPTGPDDSQDSPPGGFTNGVVTASSQVAADAGSRVLAAGGNAIDAAATVQFMLNVVEPQSSGLGGGGFLLIYLADEDKTYVIDASERAPAGAKADMFVSQADAEVRGSSGYIVGVPGTLKGIATALEKWGTTDLAAAVAPAIVAAERGVRVHPLLAEDIRSGRLDHELGDPAYDEARAVFRPTEKPLVEGDMLTQPFLARTLKILAADGTSAFYDCGDDTGLAEAIVEAQRATREVNPDGVGSMTCDDLQKYDVVIRNPLSRPYRNYTVVTAPPPSAGGVGLLQMLGVLERFPIGGEDMGPMDSQTLNLEQEAMRLAYADRAMWIGDPDVVRVPVAGLLSTGYIEDRSRSIQLGARIPEIVAGDPRPFDPTDRPEGMIAPVTGDPRDGGGHTTHFNVIDGAGNMVSWTSTLSSAWGSGLMVPNYGFMLNDSLSNFNHHPTRSTDPNAIDPGTNDPAPNKRPLSSMAPTLLFVDGRPIAAYGAAGGSTILSTMLTLTLNLVDHDMKLAEAIAAPRLTLQSGSRSAVTGVEPGLMLKNLEPLRRLGYSFDLVFRLGAAQAAVLFPATGESYGAADPRRLGGVAGPSR